MSTVETTVPQPGDECWINSLRHKLAVSRSVRHVVRTFEPPAVFYGDEKITPLCGSRGVVTMEPNIHADEFSVCKRCQTILSTVGLG